MEQQDLSSVLDSLLSVHLVFVEVESSDNSLVEQQDLSFTYFLIIYTSFVELEPTHELKLITQK